MIVEPFRTQRDEERCFEPASSQPSESVPLRKSRPNLAVDVVAECADAFRSSYWTLRGRRVGLRRILGILVLARNHNCYPVAISQYGDDWSDQPVARRRLRTAPEKLHNGVSPRRDVWIVLDVARGQPLVGFVPMVALQQVLHDVERRLLVRVQLRTLIGEERLRIRDAFNRFLREDGSRCERSK